MGLYQQRFTKNFNRNKLQRKPKEKTACGMNSFIKSPTQEQYRVLSVVKESIFFHMPHVLLNTNAEELSDVYFL